jgi:hypothetical protein
MSYVSRAMDFLVSIFHFVQSVLCYQECSSSVIYFVQMLAVHRLDTDRQKNVHGQVPDKKNSAQATLECLWGLNSSCVRVFLQNDVDAARGLWEGFSVKQAEPLDPK